MAEIDKSTGSRSTMLKVLVGLILAATAIVFARFVLVHAHRLGWTLGWIYVGLVAAATIINLVCLRRWNPELIERRMRFGKWAKSWDKLWAVLFAFAMIAIFVVVNVEEGNGASKAPSAAWLIGLAIFVPGWALVIWSMVVNPFFEKTVRIQTDHGHRVIDTGPYAFVRHPGYVGFMGWIFSTPLLLASTWAFVPALIAAALIVIRTALEDRTLQAELPSYSEYAIRVRFRLMPGIW